MKVYMRIRTPMRKHHLSLIQFLALRTIARIVHAFDSLKDPSLLQNSLISKIPKNLFRPHFKGMWGLGVSLPSRAWKNLAQLRTCKCNQASQFAKIYTKYCSEYIYSITPCVQPLKLCPSTHIPHRISLLRSPYLLGMLTSNRYSSPLVQPLGWNWAPSPTLLLELCSKTLLYLFIFIFKMKETIQIKPLQSQPLKSQPLLIYCLGHTPPQIHPVGRAPPRSGHKPTPRITPPTMQILDGHTPARDIPPRS